MGKATFDNHSNEPQIFFRKMDRTIRHGKAYLANKMITLDMVRAGLHCSFKISRQMLPLLLIFGWKTFVLKATCTNHSPKEKIEISEKKTVEHIASNPSPTIQ